MKKANIVLLILCAPLLMSWGFFAHQKINRIAVFSLPPEMIGFYKKHISYITEKAVNPDMRRYVNDAEAPRHYIDLDVYGDSAVYNLPRYWLDAVAKYGEDSLQAYGIVPWHIAAVKHWLTQAFLNQDTDAILRLSADLGHYVGDANVPLHTTENYNGQLTGQYGIHGFWESRLPELFFDEYDLFVGKADYEANTQLRAWEAVKEAHLALDTVMQFEKALTEKFDDSKKYAFEERGQTLVRVYSYNFSRAYHRKLNGMVERQMRKAIKMTADLWYTAWVDGGQPDLKSLMDEPPQIEELKIDSLISRTNEHESGVVTEP